MYFLGTDYTDYTDFSRNRIYPCHPNEPKAMFTKGLETV